MGETSYMPRPYAFVPLVWQCAYGYGCDVTKSALRPLLHSAAQSCALFVGKALQFTLIPLPTQPPQKG